MDNQLDQRRTHTPGHENHGVYVCHKCGWPFPNPHPSAKHRRAHKKICGTIEGYRQTHLNGSDDERVSDDDHKTVKTPGLVVSGSNALETGNNEKGSDGIGEKLTRSEDDVYSDAVADFSDSGLSPGVKDRLQEVSLDSGTEVEKVNTTEQKLSGSSEHSDFNVEDVSPLIVKSSDDSQIQNPEILPSESVDVGNIVGFQGQLSGSTSDPLTSSVADMGTEELTIVHGDDFSGLSSDSCPSKAEAMPDVLPEKNINAGENVTDSSLICAAEQSNLKGKDETKSEGDMVEFVDSSENIVGETCEGESKIAVSDAVSLDHEVGDEAVIVNPKEKEGPEFLSLLPQDDLPLELNSSIITNDAQVESAHVIHFATCSDVKVLQEKEEGNVNIEPLPIHDDRPDVAHPQSEYGDFKDHEGVVSQNPLSAHSSESLKHKEDVTEENDFHFDTSQLSEKIGILSSDMHVLDSSMKMETEDIHVEDCNEVSPVKPTIDSTYHRSHEIGASMKTEMNENHFSEEQEPDDHKNSQPEGSLMVSSNESQSDASFGSATGETISVIDIDNTSHHMKNRTEINDIAVDGKNVGANVENDTEIILRDFQPSDLLLQSKVEQSSGLFKNDAAGEMGKTEQCEELPTERDTSMPKSASFRFESPVISDVVIDGPARKSNGTECTNIDSVSDKIEDEINSNIKPYEESNRSVGTSADSHEAPDAQLLVKAAEDLARKYTSHSSMNTDPSAQRDSAVEDNSGGRPSGQVSGITAVPVPAQDQSGNNLGKLGSSGIDASVDSGSRCDSLEGNWGSVSVLSMQSNAPAVTDAEILPTTGSLASTEAGKSNSNTPRAAADRQWSRKPEMFEPPSFMTLVESSHAVSPKGAASEVVQNPQQPSSTSQACWFPTLNQVINESQGRKSNEEIIAKVTNWSTSKEHTPLKSLLGEATHSNNKPKSPNMEESSVSQRNGKVPENSGSGLLTTVNSILGPESPADQVAKGEAANEWNSPARYPANIKREKRKLRGRPYWIQLVCCSAVDPRRM